MERPFSIRPPWPVSFLLALSIVALAVPLLAFLGMEASRLASSESARLFGEVRVGAERIAADVDQTLNGYIAILETLATTPALTEGDFATVYRQAQAALRLARPLRFPPRPRRPAALQYARAVWRSVTENARICC